MSEEGLAIEAALQPAHGELVASALRRAQHERVADRVRSADATLWAPPGTPEVGNRLGWLTIAERMRGEIGVMRALADEIGAEGVRDVVLLGMGGSSLAPEVFSRTLGVEGDPAGPPAGRARLRVLDSTNAGAVRAVDEAIAPERTLFIVSSKSGGTIEPLSMLAHYWEIAPDGRRFVAITDPGSGLEALATERGFRHVFHGDPDIGGRYSALSAFGIVPATLIGVEVERLLAGAAQAWQTRLDPSVPGADGEAPGWLWLGSALSALARAGRDKLTFIVPRTLDGLGLWLEQLFAESTGKHGTGVLPVAEEPLCPPEAYGRDRVFLRIADRRSRDAEAEEAIAALQALGHPVISIPTTGPIDLGRLFMLAELCVACVGWGLSINPFDQPNVQEAKDATNDVLKRIAEGEQTESERDAEPHQLQELFSAGPPSYLALMGYVEPSEAFDLAIATLRRMIVQETGMTSTFGYGPRFLHSTGQFHKGGPPVGRFLQLVHDSRPDIDVPGKPYTFSTLAHAQADGDLHTLRAHQLPALRITLKGDDPAQALDALSTSAIAGALGSATRR